jgi:hypothetical protein
MNWTRRLSEISRSPELARAVWLAAAVLISLLHLFMNTPGLSRSDMSLDDAGTWGVAHQSLGTLLTLPTEFHSQPPLYYYLLHFLLYIGNSPWFLRGISWAFCWMLLLFVLFYWHELSLLSRLGFCMVFLLGGITPYLASCVRPYGMAAFLTVVSTVMLGRLADLPSRQRATAYAAWTLAMLYTMAFEVAVLLVHGLVVLGLMVGAWLGNERGEAFRRIKVWALTMTGVCALYLPYVLLAYHYQYRANATDTLSTVLSLGTYTNTLHGQFGLSSDGYWLLAVFAGLGLSGELRRRNWSVLVWPLMVIGAIAFVWYFIIGRSILGAQTKYMLPAFLAVCALVAFGLGQLQPISGRGVWAVVVGLLVVLVCLKFPAFDKSFESTRDIGPFAKLRAELIKYPGKKVWFNDVGYDTQRTAYVTRNDPDILYATQSGRGWAWAGAQAITNEYLAATVEQHRVDVSCFFYYVWTAAGPFSQVFVPTMERLGYRRTGPLPVAYGHQTVGYCRR